MVFTAETKLWTEEYGELSVKDIYQYNLRCKILTYNIENTTTEFKFFKSLTKESRKNHYIISTFKKNRVAIASDQLIYNNNNWVYPEELVVGSELWISHLKIIVSDVITDIQLIRRPVSIYMLELENNLPFFGNRILLKEQENNDE